MSIRWNKHLVILYDKQQGALICGALERAIGSAFPECDIITVDDIGYTNPIYRFWKAKLSHFYAKNARFMVSWLSKIREKKEQSRIKEERENISTGKEHKLTFSERKSAMGRIVNILNRFRPVVIVVTNRYALKMTLLAKKYTGSNVKVVAVISDFALSSEYVRSEVDLFLVENDMLKDGLMRYGVDRDKILISGMPFSEDQKPTYSRSEARNLLGLSSELPLVVVNGGEYCTATIKDKVKKLLSVKDKYALLILTYDNKSIRRFYKKTADENGIEVVFKEEMNYPLIFAAADVIVTLPETHFIYSAFVNKIPVVLVDGITVLEHDVYRYLVSGALVTPAKTPDETYAAVEELLVDTDRRNEMIGREEVYYLKERNLNPERLMYDILMIEAPNDHDD